MAERTVKVRLVADVSDYTAGLAKAAAMTRGLAGDVEKGIDRDVAPAMKRAGDKQGGILARGINTGLVRNSPLIAAGITAALAAGAPAVLAGAGILFAGIGGLAAAQTSEVREAWVGLGHDIRDSATSDAASLVPVYVGMADKIGAAFQRMRPEIRDAFTAAGPQIDSFTDSLTQAAENALPGLVRAVERGGPVVEGLGQLMEDIGTGLTDFLDAMSDNSESAGQALEALGGILGAALPLLGELLGTGSELASVVLPPLADALGLVADVAKGLGPLLPALAVGFGALRVAGTVSKGVDALAQSLAFMSYGAGGGAAGKASTAVAGLGRALPLAALTMGAFTLQTDKNEDRISQWTRTLLEGGAGADVLRQKAEDARNASFWSGVGGAVFFQDLWDDDWSGNVVEDFDAAEKAANELGGSQENLASSIDMATAAMSAQALQIAAAANSDLAYRMSVDATEDAVAALNTAITDYGAGSEEASDAGLALEQSLLQQAANAQQAAVDLNAYKGETAAAAAGDAAFLAELLNLQATMGASFPAALNTTIARLQGTTSAGATAAAQFGKLGLEVLAVPNSKTIIVSSTTPEQQAQLERLGYTVRTLPDGRVEIVAQTAAAEAGINYVARDRVATITVRQVAGSNQSVPGSSIRSTVATGGAIENGRVQHFDGGGAVRGPGGPKSDLVPAMLSNGEHVWNSAEVAAAGGQAAVAAMRRAVLSGREVSGVSASSAGGADIGRLASEIAGILSSRPTVGQITTQRNETGFELAERLAFQARTA